ncbi:MAG: hypothetical protein OEM82_01055 [Acidobacteriota bacterium]|nr:hypothetical protein [Acidobacteriota bacterium]
MTNKLIRVLTWNGKFIDPINLEPRTRGGKAFLILYFLIFAILGLSSLYDAWIGGEGLFYRILDILVGIFATYISFVGSFAWIWRRMKLHRVGD